jgi:2-C-methyl-D-erythritol 4-phosphate cytidylyltransferase
MNTAIIAGAGRGTRFNSQTPKQFIELLGMPVIMHAIIAFERSALVSEIILVTNSDGMDSLNAIVSNAGCGKVSKVVSGGRHRIESVRNGFEAADPAAKIVLVHDGVRPLVSEKEIADVIEAATKAGAACLAAPVTETIKEVSEGRIVRTIDRNYLRRALTPQAFKYEILKEALASADLDETVTDECFLVEKLGREVAVVEGDHRNIKITHPEDLILAEAFLTAAMFA